MADQSVCRSDDDIVEVREGGGKRPVRSLVIGGVVAGDDSPLGLVMQSRLGLLPALMHVRADDVLAIGLGTGVTLGALSAALGKARVTAVERCAAVLEAARSFRDHWARPIDGPTVTLIAGDGREHLSAAGDQYDLIAVDLVSPADGGRLFSRAFYRLCAERLAEGGVVTQWLPLFQIPMAALRGVVRAFLDVFPEAALWMAGFSTFKPVAMLAGGRGAPAPDDAAAAALSAVPAAGLPTLDRARSLRLLDANGLRAFAGDAPAFDERAPLVDDDMARDGLPDGGLANLAALVDCAKEIDGTQCTFFDAASAHARGDLPAALAGYRRVHQAWPDDPLVRLAAAQATCSLFIQNALSLWAGNETGAAEDALRQAIATAPVRADARDYLAKLLTSLGRHEEALAEIDAALELDPDDPDLAISRNAIRHNLAGQSGT